MSKTILLINSLSRSERQTFKQELKKNKRAGIYLLYTTIEKHLPEPVPKPLLFEQVFKKKYCSQEDYLLRNLQRHLNKQLKRFLAQPNLLPLEKAQAQEKQLLSTLLERKQYKLFKTEWQQAYKKSQKQAQYQHQVALINLYLTYAFSHEEIQEATYIHLQELITEGLAASIWAGQEQYQALEVKLAITQRHLKSFKPSYVIHMPTNPYHSFEESAPPLMHFLDLLKQSYLNTGIEKIHILQQILEHYPYITSIRAAYKEKELPLSASLALEYFMLQEFDKAAMIYEQLLPDLEKASSPLTQFSILFNYCSNQLYLGEYQTIISIYHQWQEAFQAIPKFYYRFLYLTCMAYVFLEQADKAFELLGQTNISQRSESDYYYARNLYAIIYFELEDWENCERELINTLQSLRYKSSSIPFLLYRTQMLKELLNIVLDDKSKTALYALEQKIKKQLNNYSLVNPQSLILQWILKKIPLLLQPL